MLRRRYSALCAASLLISLASFGLWIRSYRHVDKIEIIVHPAWAMFVSDYGALHVFFIASALDDARLFRFWFNKDLQIRPGVDIGDENPEFSRAGIAWGADQFTNNGERTIFTQRYIRLNYLWPALLGLVLPTAWLRSFFKRRRLVQMSPLCSVCGYDLRATPDRCPECGTATQHQSALKPI